MLDVKSGSGAFMEKEEDAVRLAEIMVDTTRHMGKKCVALLTDMNQPLGRMAGHANEVVESIEVLKGKGPADLRELSLELSAWMFYLGERAKSVEEGRQLADEMITSGKALKHFRECIRLQGGDPRVVDDTSLLPMAKLRAEVKSPRSGYITSTHCRDLGVALAMLGGGREKKEDRIDHGVGLEFHNRSGQHVQAGEKLVTIQYNSESKVAEAKELIAASFQIGDGPEQAPPLIHRIIGA